MPNEVDFQVATLQCNTAKADATGGPWLREPVLNGELEAVLNWTNRDRRSTFKRERAEESMGHAEIEFNIRARR